MEVTVEQFVVHISYGNQPGFRSSGFHFPEQSVFLVRMGGAFLVVPRAYCTILSKISAKVWSGAQVSSAIQYILAHERCVESLAERVTDENLQLPLIPILSPLGNQEVDALMERPSGLLDGSGISLATTHPDENAPEEETAEGRRVRRGIAVSHRNGGEFWRDTQLDRSLRRDLEDSDLL